MLSWDSFETDFAQVENTDIVGNVFPSSVGLIHTSTTPDVNSSGNLPPTKPQLMVSTDTSTLSSDKCSPDFTTNVVKHGSSITNIGHNYNVNNSSSLDNSDSNRIHNPSPFILNLCENYTLSDIEIKALTKGLNFVPTPGEPVYADIANDVEKFCRFT